MVHITLLSFSWIPYEPTKRVTEVSMNCLRPEPGPFFVYGCPISLEQKLLLLSDNRNVSSHLVDVRQEWDLPDQIGRLVKLND